MTMSATNGIMTRMEVIDMGAPLSASIDRVTLRRILNVFRELVNNLGRVDIHIISINS